eukprot:GABV01000262.1.p5 GENE.GABV01000262.1~~GABV01000262.1.p5  ORF type:complete len:103 (-),score=30.40 GABV01000262.1:359-667(-)
MDAVKDFEFCASADAFSASTHTQPRGPRPVLNTCQDTFFGGMTPNLSIFVDLVRVRVGDSTASNWVADEKKIETAAGTPTWPMWRLMLFVELRQRQLAMRCK